MNTYTLAIKISGITCDACIRLITIKVKRIPSVSDIAIQVKSGDTTITSSSPITIDIVKESLKNTTYLVSLAN